MKRIFSTITSFCILSSYVWAVPDAFPGAEGAGRYATGGRSGDVYHVTNLNDSGAGSLRYGLDSASGPRTIVFDIGGNIHLTSNLSIGSDITIAGQTAPGDGITVCDRQTSVSGDNIIIRYLRFRPGDTYCPGYEPDSLGVTYSYNVVIDHVSASWGIDEVLSTTHESTNVTVQWSMITEALHNSCHSKGNHGYGSLINGGDFTFHHNLYAHNRSRNPRPGAGLPSTRLDFVNNVIYNPGDRFGYTGADGAAVYLNYVGNYGISGPSTSSTDLLYSPDTDTHVYQSGNKMDTNKNGTVDGTDTGWAMFGGTYTIETSRVSLPLVTTDTADDAYVAVVDLAGASLVRDAVDTRVIETVINQNGAHIDSPADVGGWPTLSSGTAPTDTDQDGMPDAWETANGLNLNNAADRNDFDLHAEYTNLEVYLNSLVDTGTGDITPPTVPTGLSALAGDGTVDLDWGDNSEGDLAGYYVYRSTTSGSDYVILSTLLADSNYIDDTAENGTTYFYVVKAVDASSNKSDYSDEVFATPVDMSFYRDTNDDHRIDMTDLIAFLQLWLQSDCLLATGWDINNDCLINLDEWSLLASYWQAEQEPPIVPIDLVASQGKMVQYKNDSGAWVSEECLKTRSAGVWDDDPALNTLDAAKSWVQFDLSGISGTITSATLTIYAITDAKSYYVNSLNDGVDETWSADTIDWFSAPGNTTTSGSALDAGLTSSLYFVNPTTADGAASGDVTSFVNADTDGLLTFILTPGGTTYIYNVIEGSYYNPDYVPVLTLEVE